MAQNLALGSASCVKMKLARNLSHVDADFLSQRGPGTGSAVWAQPFRPVSHTGQPRDIGGAKRALDL